MAARCEQGHEWEDAAQTVCPVCGAPSAPPPADPPTSAATVSPPFEETWTTPIFHEVLAGADKRERPLQTAFYGMATLLTAGLLIWLLLVEPEMAPRAQKPHQEGKQEEKPFPPAPKRVIPKARAWSFDRLDPAKLRRNPLGYTEVVAVVGSARPEHLPFLRGRVFPPDAAAYLAFTPDGNKLVCVDHTHYLRAWDLSTQKEMANVKLRGGLLPLAIEPTGQAVIVDSQEWDLATRKPRALKRQTLPLKAVAYARDGSLLATASSDSGNPFHGEVKVWDLQTGQEQLSLTLPTAVQCLAFAPDGQALAWGGWNGSITVWDLKESKRRLVRFMDGAVNALAFSRLGTSLAAGDSHGRLRRWEILTGEEVIFQVGHQHPVMSLAYSDDGTTVLSVEMGGRAILWDANGGDQLRDWPSFRFSHGVIVAPDGRHLAAASVDGSVSILRLLRR